MRLIVRFAVAPPDRLRPRDAATCAFPTTYDASSGIDGTIWKAVLACSPAHGSGMTPRSFSCVPAYHDGLTRHWYCDGESTTKHASVTVLPVVTPPPIE